MIPKGWKEYNLKDLLVLLTDFEANGSFSSVKENVSVYDSQNFAWYVRATDLENKTELSKVKYVDEKSYNFLRKTTLYGGEVLITKRGEIGKVYLFENKGVKSTLAPNLYLLKLNDIAIPKYIYYFFKSALGNKQLLRNDASSTLGALYKDDVKAIKVVLPTKNEQELIVNIIATCDEAIEKLSMLIASKEKQKKGLMQNLLSGEIRFKEFPEEDYIEGNLSEFVDLRHGYQFRKVDFVKEGVPVIKIGNVNGYHLDLNDLTYIDNSRLEEFKDVIISNGDLLMSLTGNIGRVVEVSNMTIPMVQNYRVGKFISRDEGQLSKSYLKHLLSSDVVTRQFLNMSNQSAQANFGKQDMDKIYITFPKKIDEQRKISATITESENEIKNLNLQLEKIKSQKKGLMQQLLTGKIRVK